VSLRSDISCSAASKAACRSPVANVTTPRGVSSGAVAKPAGGVVKKFLLARVSARIVALP
jgi:hypothetical protein